MFNFSEIINRTKEIGVRSAIAQITADAEGRMLKLQVDSASKTIKLELGPKGEDAPIQVEIQSYRVDEQDGATSIFINQITSDRPLYNLALQTFVAGKSFVVPADAAAWLKLFL